MVNNELREDDGRKHLLVNLRNFQPGGTEETTKTPV
jgi:hypothetical protein